MFGRQTRLLSCMCATQRTKRNAANPDITHLNQLGMRSSGSRYEYVLVFVLSMKLHIMLSKWLPAL